MTSLDGKNLFSMEHMHLPKPENSKPSISITLGATYSLAALSRSPWLVRCIYISLTFAQIECIFGQSNRKCSKQGTLTYIGSKYIGKCMTKINTYLCTSENSILYAIYNIISVQFQSHENFRRGIFWCRCIIQLTLLTKEIGVCQTS